MDLRPLQSQTAAPVRFGDIAFIHAFLVFGVLQNRDESDHNYENRYHGDNHGSCIEMGMNGRLPDPMPFVAQYKRSVGGVLDLPLRQKHKVRRSR